MSTPIVPTKKMLKAGEKAIENYSADCFAWELKLARLVWEAMHKAHIEEQTGEK